MSDTPETDDAQFGTGRVTVDFARRLERQRDDAREQLAKHQCSFAGTVHIQNGEYAELCEAVRQRDELLEALENIAKQKILDEVEDPVCCDFEDGYTTCVEVARAAIAAVKGGNQ